MTDIAVSEPFVPTPVDLVWAADQLLPLCTAKTQQIYHSASGMAGTRWVMLTVDDEAQLQDFEALVGLRAKPAPRKGG